MDYAFEHHKIYIGRHVRELPTPSLIINKSIIAQNINKLHDDVSRLGISFRPHLKTLKTLEITRLMLGNGLYRKVVCSTIPEIVGSLPLVKEGLLDEAIFGMPVYKSVIPRLTALRKEIKIDLLVDSCDQLALLESSGATWDVFIKIDVGARRAGLATNSPRLKELLQAVEASQSANLKGIYCHANHSYGCRTEESVVEMLQHEVAEVAAAASFVSTTRPLIVSIGATPTAHVIDRLNEKLPPNVTLELHAGNFPTNDLQQVSTGVISINHQAIRVCADVVSVYPERNEALINAGVIVLAREASEYPGHGKVVDQQHWDVIRVSQEHGILGCTKQNVDEKVGNLFKVGEKVFLWCQHSCITAAAFYAYFVVDENDIVIGTWIPWKGW
ncbi:hypothetical protein BU24DRAFT_48297 [Aaosphaeria arxii CBS 175.79]|uniref:D-serine dehydratase n=1 Tax=Aaosphaeria arxii CBS 175.79 TaxID=1450172 RepID=A0A6A5XCR7_9PLEO|nr:uncharacterized protein BU24DRAFT_48297 [Aaosphaeria arxii CBS 175.79]KAF2010905.1 hypothetical protein BU24DRAFT_48297 [Aaosphaeria arxii CBS 175.79]